MVNIILLPTKDTLLVPAGILIPFMAIINNILISSHHILILSKGVHLQGLGMNGMV